MKAKPVTDFDSYRLYDETQEGGKAPALMHDASRPYVVIYRDSQGSTRILGRWRSRAVALAAIRRHRG